MKSKKYFFSLTELLIVVAIFLVLISFLSPSLKRALETSYKLTCQKYLQANGISIYQFTEDHEGFLPIWVGHLKYAGEENILFPDRLINTYNSYRWYSNHNNNLYWDYYKDVNKLICPAHTERNAIMKSSNPYSYAVSERFSRWTNGTGAQKVKAKLINMANDKFMMLDRFSPTHSNDYFFRSYDHYQLPIQLGIPHGGMNVIFFDMHTDFLKMEQAPQTTHDYPLETKFF